MRAMSAAVSARSRRPGPIVNSWRGRRGGRAGPTTMVASVARRAGQHPHQRRHPLDADARRGGRRPGWRPRPGWRARSGCGSGTGRARAVASGMTTSTTRCSLRTSTPPISHVVRERRRVGQHVRRGRAGSPAANSSSCADADRRDEEDHPGRGEQAAHDEQLDGPADQRADREAGGERQPVRHVPVEDHAGEQRGREPAHLGDGEVDDPVRPEDEDQRRRPSRRRSTPVHRAGEGDLPGTSRARTRSSVGHARGTRRGPGRRGRPAPRPGPRSGSGPSP